MSTNDASAFAPEKSSALRPLEAVASPKFKQKYPPRDKHKDLHADGAKDTRKCDYALVPIPPHTIANVHHASSTLKKAKQFFSQTNDTGRVLSASNKLKPNRSENTTTDTSGMIKPQQERWRMTLDYHVLGLLKAIHFDERELKMVFEMGSLKESAMNVHTLYRRFRTIAKRLGEELYSQLRQRMLKANTNGIFDEQVNAIRLETMYKIEIRRKLTLEKLKEEIVNQFVQEKKRTEALGGLAQDNNDNVVTANKLPPSIAVGSDDQVTYDSVHQYKLQALERALANERIQTIVVMNPVHDDVFGSNSPNSRRRRQGQGQAKSTATTNSTKSTPQQQQQQQQQQSKQTKNSAVNSSVSSLRVTPSQLQRMSRQMELIKQKMDSFLYTKNSLEIWPSIPMDETARIVRHLLVLMTTMAIFEELSMDQKVDMIRAMQPRSFDKKSIVLKKNQVSEEIGIVYDGDIETAAVDVIVETRTDNTPMQEHEQQETDENTQEQQHSTSIIDTTKQVTQESDGSSKGRETVNSPLEEPLSSCVSVSGGQRVSYFGELGILAREPSRVTLRASTHTLCFVITRAAFDFVLQRSFTSSSTSTTAVSFTATGGAIGSPTRLPRPHTSPYRRSGEHGGKKALRSGQAPHGFDPSHRRGSRASSSSYDTNHTGQPNGPKPLSGAVLQEFQSQKIESSKVFRAKFLEEIKQKQAEQEEQERQQMNEQDSVHNRKDIKASSPKRVKGNRPVSPPYRHVNSSNNNYNQVETFEEEEIEDTEEDEEEPYVFEWFPHFTDETYPPNNLRLKSMKPIPMGMEKIELGVWGPSIPDTGSHLLPPVVTVFQSALMKDHLRHLVKNQTLASKNLAMTSVTSPVATTTANASSTTASTPVKTTAAPPISPLTPVNPPAPRSARRMSLMGGASPMGPNGPKRAAAPAATIRISTNQASHITAAAGHGEMSLAQFSETRKNLFVAAQQRTSIHEDTISEHNSEISGSVMVTSTSDTTTAPFIHSVFVPESLFQDVVEKKTEEQEEPEQESEVEESEEEEEEEEQEEVEDQVQEDEQRVEQQEHSVDDPERTEQSSSAEANIASSPSKSVIPRPEAPPTTEPMDVREKIVKKHLAAVASAQVHAHIQTTVASSPTPPRTSEAQSRTPFVSASHKKPPTPATLMGSSSSSSDRKSEVGVRTQHTEQSSPVSHTQHPSSHRAHHATSTMSFSNETSSHVGGGGSRVKGDTTSPGTTTTTTGIRTGGTGPGPGPGPGSKGEGPLFLSTTSAPLPLRVDLQKRMEKTLEILKLGAKAKLEIVFKYTNAQFYSRFENAVELWEQATFHILQREKILEEIRTFEMIASDPRRLFRGSSIERLQEAKERQHFLQQLTYLSELCQRALEEVERKCGDQVMYQNRIYREKMKKDYSELLYEVEQERLQIIYEKVRPNGLNSNRAQTAGATAAAAGGGTVAREGGRRRQAVDGDENSTEDTGGRGGILMGTSTTFQPRHQLVDERESLYVPLSEVALAEKKKRLLLQEKKNLTNDQVIRIQQELRDVTSRPTSQVSHGERHKMSIQVKVRRQSELVQLAKELEAESQERGINLHGKVHHHTSPVKLNLVPDPSTKGTEVVEVTPPFPVPQPSEQQASSPPSPLPSSGKHHRNSILTGDPMEIALLQEALEKVVGRCDSRYGLF